MRISVLFACYLFLSACGGGEKQSLQQPSSNALLVNKSSPANSSPTLNVTNGIPESVTSAFWQLDKSVTLNFFATTNDQLYLPDTVTAYKNSFESSTNIFAIDEHGFVTLYTLFDAEVQDVTGDISYDTCIHEQTHIENWVHLYDNRFRVFNSGQSIEVEIDFTQTSLAVKQRNGVLRYERSDATLSDLYQFYLCVDPIAKGVRLDQIKDKIATSLVSLKGLWRTTNNIHPVNIGFTGTRLPNAKREYVEFDEFGNGTGWLFDEKRKCFTDLKKTVEVHLENEKFIETSFFLQTQIRKEYLLHNIEASVGYGFYGNKEEQRSIMQLTQINTMYPEPTIFLEAATVATTVQNNMCEISQSTFDSLSAAQTVDDVTGIWSLSNTQEEDLRYIQITDNGVMIRYDYRGDTYNNGIHCYLETKRSEAAYLSENLFEEKTNEGFNNIISFFKSAEGELVIQSEDQQNDEYNRLLKKADAIEQTGITPLCPSVRNE